LRSVLCFLAVVFLAWSPAPARAGDAGQQLLYLATWPHQIVIFDATQEKVVDTIDLKTDVPGFLILSPDKKKLYLNTVKDNSIVTIDLATRKPASSFSLNSGNRNVRVMGLTPDPTGKYLYGLATVITKQIDHYDIDPPSFIVIDLAARKIIRTGEFPKDEDRSGVYADLRVSPDGKLLYLFSENILVLDTTSFHVVKKIDLAKPLNPGVENLSMDLLDDPNELPGKVTSVFHFSDPYVHRVVFGIGSIDLAKLSFDFSAVGPVEAGRLMPLRLTPDRKIGYTVAINGSPGNRRCEFWAFDMPSRKLIREREFDGRNRFSFALSADGSKIFIYGAGYDIEVYDTKTLELRNKVVLPGDVTSNMIVMPAASTAVSAQRTQP
jgi:WD40 repeat protein